MTCRVWRMKKSLRSWIAMSERPVALFYARQQLQATLSDYLK